MSQWRGLGAGGDMSVRPELVEGLRVPGQRFDAVLLIDGAQRRHGIGQVQVGKGANPALNHCLKYE